MRTLSFEILRRASLVALGAVALAGAAGCKVSVTGGGDGCEYNGETYEPGASFPAGDGCNSCFCDEDGNFGGCTEMYCIGTCEWKGQLYEEGQSFPAGDGCNTCSCEADGQVACTLLGCVTCEYLGKTYQPGETFPAGDNCHICQCSETGDVACSIGECPQEACSYEGYFHAPGESWLSNDQCTSCTCQGSGQAECASGVACDTCYYAGALHQSGQSFPALDGCNTCVCDGGGVSCTEIACACDPEKEWHRGYAGDAETCQVIDFACADPTTPFFNECGCGCEQPAWCPEYFDCMPPASCDVQAIQQLCPYSGIAY